MVVIKSIASIFMATFFIIQTKNIYEDVLKYEDGKAHLSDIVIDCIIELFIVITILTIWF